MADARHGGHSADVSDPALKPADIVAELQALIARPRPSDVSEERSMKRVAQLLKTSGRPFWRGQVNPGHLTASAVVVDGERTKTLLIHHEKLQRWLQPGGHFEVHETQPVDVAAREVKEETGLTTSWPGALPRLLDVDVHAIPARPNEPAHYHYDLRYLLVAQGDPVAGDGTTQAKWFTYDELATLDLDPGLRRALGKVSWKGRSGTGTTSGVGSASGTTPALGTPAASGPAARLAAGPAARPAATPAAGTPIAGTPIATTPSRGTPLAGTPLSAAPTIDLSDLGLPPAKP